MKIRCRLMGLQKEYLREKVIDLILRIFRCLIIKSNETIMTTRKGRIVNAGSSGMVGVGAGLAEAEIEPAGMVTVCVLLQPLATPSN